MSDSTTPATSDPVTDPILQQDASQIKTTTQKTELIVVLIVLATVLLLGVALWWWYKKYPQNQNLNAATTIRNLFAGKPTAAHPTPTPVITTSSPPAIVFVPSFTPPPPSDESAPRPQNVNASGDSVLATPSNSSGPLIPRGKTFASGSSAHYGPNPPAPVASSVAGATLYHNQALGFELTIPAGWSQATQADENYVTFFYGNGQPAGYVEVYSNTSGETLNSLLATLQNNSDVIQVSQTSINGIPALQFSSSGGSGLAFLANNKIYYLRGSLVSHANQIKFF